ncbi:MAG: GTPase ObgE [Alphaproteobacteria bacterium]|nr:GTPase ObgE [Alphaproteobacteria bacterium]
MKFLDQAKIYLKAGDGGNGCIAFRHEKFVEYGGPNGGNGGKGANVYFEAVENLNTLIDFRYQQHFRAPKGVNGSGRSRAGAKGENLIIKVPVGTEILAEDGKTLIKDMTTAGERFLIAKGGKGGRGNEFFKTSTNQAPEYAEDGEEGEEYWVWLRLKLIADVGLVGLPNAGKSTLLSMLTKARPKIANYPFTTLHPNLGVAMVDDKEILLADIPGLIEGASEGAGLGINFLRHVDRCSVLIHLIDGTEEDIAHSYQVIRQELEKYSPSLAAKKEVLAINKADSLLPEDLEKKKKELEACSKKEVFVISAIAGQGILPLLRRASSYIKSKGE